MRINGVRGNGYTGGYTRAFEALLFRLPNVAVSARYLSFMTFSSW